MTSGAPIETPCVNVCVLEADGLCRGCARTADEIARWRDMTPAARRAVMAALPARKEHAR